MQKGNLNLVNEINAVHNILSIYIYIYIYRQFFYNRYMFRTSPVPSSRGITVFIRHLVPVPVAARSKALVYGRSTAEIVGSNSTGGMDVCLL